MLDAIVDELIFDLTINTEDAVAANKKRIESLMNGEVNGSLTIDGDLIGGGEVALDANLATGQSDTLIVLGEVSGTTDVIAKLWCTIRRLVLSCMV